MKILIITSSGGSGHILAAEAKRLEILASHPGATIIIKDMIADFQAKWLYSLVISLWNQQQRKGKVLWLRFLSSMLWLSNALFFLPAFIRLYQLIVKENFDEILDTQGNSTKAALSALLCARLRGKGPRFIHKFVVELPTKDTTYVFASIRSLGPILRKFLKLHTIDPLLEEVASKEAFWKKYTKMPLNQIVHGLPLRPRFLQPIAFTPIKEQLHLNEDTHITTIMLGSQPTPLSIMPYIEAWIAQYRESRTPHALVVMCSQDKSLKEAIEAIQLPPPLYLIALGQTGDDLVAPLLKYSKITITRSGGVTSHELLAVAEGQILIHSEAPPHRIMKGMPIWEEGNARYLIKHKNARLVTPADSQQGRAIFS